jgi:integrase
VSCGVALRAPCGPLRQSDGADAGPAAPQAPRLTGAKLDRGWKTPDVERAVDRRRVASPAQIRQLLDAIRSTGISQGARLVALYGCMYYGMLRPSESVSLRLDECELPEQGWGSLEFREVRSVVGREWADDG